MRLIDTMVELVGRGIRREVASLRPRVFFALACHHALAAFIWMGTFGVLALIIGVSVAIARRGGIELGLFVGGALAILGSVCSFLAIARRV